jgi:adenylyltransferase/sulfurtransferase
MSDQLSPQEILRYQRHLTLPGFGEAAQLRLKAARVLVVGAGGLGCPALQYLAAAGVGTLGVVDDDQVSRSNLQRQILFTDADVGQPKAEVAAARLRAMNREINCEAHVARVTVANALDLIGAYDVVLDGSDNFTTRYLINDACVLLGKPLVYGALYTFQGQASVFNFKGGPTYRCLFPEPPRPEDSPNCSEIGVLGVLPGIVGTIQATETIKVITGVGTPLSGKLLIFDALQMTQQVVYFKRLSAHAGVQALKAIDYTCAVPVDTPSEEISVEALQASAGHYQLLDVRESWERKICHLAGAHLPLKEILSGEANFTAIGIDRDRPVCLYCKSGVRSLQAAQALRTQYGFTQIKSLGGGILAWAEKVDISLTTY